MEQKGNSTGSVHNQTKTNITIVLPGMAELTAADLDFPWYSIDRLFSETWKAKVKEAGGKAFKVKPTFFYMLLAALKGNSQALGYVDYLNRMCHELAGRLSVDQKKMLSTPVKKLLKTPSLDFLNFVGELATLNNLLKTNVYTLEKVESPLANNNSIDFRLKNLNTEKSILVEVTNIHVNDKKVEDDPVAINTFLSGRLSNKIAQKEEELAGSIDFWVVAVLWAGWKSVDIYRRHFLAHSLSNPRTIEPLAYLQHSDGLGYFWHQFGRVSTLRLATPEPMP